jgi:hypothetical protein
MGGGFISCQTNNDKEIGHASSLHNVVMANCTYDADYLNYNDCDAPSQLSGSVQREERIRYMMEEGGRTEEG